MELIGVSDDDYEMFVEFRCFFLMDRYYLYFYVKLLRPLFLKDNSKCLFLSKWKCVLLVSLYVCLKPDMKLDHFNVLWTNYNLLLKVKDCFAFKNFFIAVTYRYSKLFNLNLVVLTDHCATVWFNFYQDWMEHY